MYQLTGVAKTYGAGDTLVTAVDDLDLRIEQGEFVVVAGPSGSGKTTLLQLLGALDRPTRGEVLFEGQDVNRQGDGDLARLRRETLGFIFQQFNLIPTLTAAQNVEVALAPRKLKAAYRHERAQELLERVGLGGRTDHLPSQLSGGEQQRVAIARALANDPRVLLADEPTGNLDSRRSRDVLGLLRELSDERGIPVLLVTHDPQALRFVDRACTLRDGILSEGLDVDLDAAESIAP